MKKIANSSELSRYYSDVNRYIDEYISSYRVSPTEIFRYINKNMSRFLEKFGIKDVENIDKIVRDVIEHRRNMEKDKVFKFEQFNLKLNESLIDIGDSTIEHEKVLADYFNTSIGHIEVIDPKIHLFEIKDFETIIRTIIFSSEELETLKSKIINMFISEVSNKEVNINSIGGNLLQDSFTFLLTNIVSQEKLTSNVESKLTEDVFLNLLSKMIPNYITGHESTICEYKGNIGGYYLWTV
jgi:hypothetical protein